VEKEIIEDEEVPGIENWADDAGVTGNTPDASGPTAQSK
jgi:hypothetical protein